MNKCCWRRRSSRPAATPATRSSRACVAGCSASATQVLLAQAQQSAGCNASHTVEARMCRWLLRIRDLTGSDDMKLTQEFLAQMLGVRRTSVSLIAGTLQKAGFIKYRRGHITLLDMAQLQQGACECYETVKGHYER